VRRSVKYGLCGGLASAAVFAGVTATASGIDKAVIVNVDGTPVAVKTSAAHVGDVLKQLGYSVQAHDQLAPAAGSALHSGEVVVFKRGRQLHLSVNGASKAVWTTAPTVGSALTQLGYPGNVYSSVAPTQPLVVGVTDIEVRTPKSVVLTADGERQTVTTTAATVGAVLTELGVKVSKKDIVQPSLATTVKAKTAIRIIRVRDGNLVAHEAVAFAVVERPNAKMTVGQSTIVRAGVEGKATVTYKVTYRNGKIANKTEIGRLVTKAPVDQIVKVGTKPRPIVRAAGSAPRASAPVVAPQSSSSGIATPAEAQNIAWQIIKARGWGRNQFYCLAQLWGHESGWSVTSGNAGGTYGIPQANPGSKMSVAGADWQTSARTQILWGLGYITAKYGTPCGAWGTWQSQGWY
jgi:uncharacterized protein YabE (DUF348 family)